LNTRGIAIVSLLLAVAVILFHQTAKKAPSEEETSLTNSMNQPAAWQGRRAPEVTAELLSKETFSLSDHVGKKVVILNFFATWCGPCKAEMPELIRFAEKHKNDPLLFIGVDASEPESTVQDFVLEQGVTYPVALDRDGRLQKAFSIRSYPTTVLIGADGTVQLYEVGSISNADVAFDALLAPAFAAINAGTGITREAFLDKTKAAGGKTAPAAPLDESKQEEPALDGRAKTIADKMNCPCGCAHTLVACTCKTAKDIKAQLRTRDWTGKADEEVMTTLNREYCMK
jgi:thiol-disulfide isomerase/thioredoxin